MVSRDSIDDREAKVRACEEVLKSRAFARSEQLVQFLRYICELELEGHGSEITEYSIATNALNRPADYSPGEDSSVRSRAHALRRKLQEYYATEAPDAALRIELPKGSYRPLFVPRSEPAAASVLPASTVRAAARASHALRAWVILMSVSTAVLAGILVFRALHSDPIDPLVRAAWGPVLQRDGDVLIVVSSPPLIRPVPSQPDVKPLGTAPNGPTELAPKWATQWYKGLNMNDHGGPLYLSPSHGYSVVSDSFAAMAVSSLLGAAGVSYHAMPESGIQLRAIHETGLVVIGAPAYTPYLARILKSMPYSFWFDPNLNNEVLGTHSAGTGREYAPKRDPQTNRYSTVYGLITVLPSQPGHPRPERMLLFAGFTGSPGAQAAIDYFRSPAALSDLAQRFRKQGYTGFPPAYQVVVRCGVDMETAINAVYETHVVLPAVPVLE